MPIEIGEARRPVRSPMLRRFLAPLVVLALASGPAAGANAADLAKGISFSGPQPLRVDGHPNDYRSWGNADYVKSSGTGWVKLWVSWADLQDAPASTLAGSWSQLNTAPGGSKYLRRLDGQIHAANADGVKVLLTIYQAFPTWATGATGSDPLSSKPAIQKLPLDLSPDGPWAWFVGYLSNRYDGSSVLAGRVDALEVMNEPNTLYWPQ